MAHEFGHAMQGRFGFAASGRSIQDETQADCFAGAWTGWVAEGKAEHVSLRTPELDDVIRGFLLLRDDVGSDPNDSQAHGSYFDRVSAFYEGFDGGVGACRDDFGADRLYTAAAFDPRTTTPDQGNASFDQIVEWVGHDPARVLDRRLPHRLRQRLHAARRCRASTGPRPDCAGVQDRDLGYCADDNDGLPRRDGPGGTPAYDEIGDFALTTALSLPYSLAVRDQAGPVDRRRRRHPLGRLPDRLVRGPVVQRRLRRTAPGAVISPGDIDEAVQFLLEYGVRPRGLPEHLGVRLRAGRRLPDRLPAGRRRLRPADR